MRKNIFLILSILLIMPTFYCSKPTADIILYNGEVYTMDESRPWANAVVISGNRIIAVLDAFEEIQQYKTAQTRMIDLKNKFVLPGFIDGHVHFNRAGELINDVNLMAVSDNNGLIEELKRVIPIVGKDEWITGGIWGAYEKWSLGAETSQGRKQDRWKPTRDVIDSITKDNPCLLSSYDGALFLANTPALAKAGLTDNLLVGMDHFKDGSPSGLIHKGSPAIRQISDVMQKKSRERLLAENKAALRKLRESGIVEVHDIAKPDQTDRFVELQKNGELTCRVWLRPDLSRAQEMQDKEMTMGLHPQSRKKDGWLRYGALKGYIDGIMGTHGALFFEPYDDQPGNYGHYRRHTSDAPDFSIPNMDKMYDYIKIGYAAGFVSNVHAIGTRGVSLMLDTYERLMKDLNSDLGGFRVIHAQVIRAEDFPRFKQLNVIAEVNPYHISDDMRWMEERIGHERCKGAYAFKSLLDNGALLSFGSDWPGTSAAEYLVHPKYLIHAAVNRTTLNGKPAGGWFPEQKISMHEALKAYTINNAYAAFEDNIRGSITAGKLADITVCDLNLMKIDPSDILNMNIEMTIVDGEIVFER